MDEKQIVDAFAQKMLAKLELRKDRYVPMGWKTLDFKRLVQLLYGEISELQDAEKEANFELAKSDCADIANYAMFIHELLNKNE